MPIKKRYGVSRETRAGAEKVTHPAEWARKKMFRKREIFFKSNEGYHIKGLKGYPSNKGYLAWLRRFHDKADREDLIGVVATDRAKFLGAVHREIDLEIGRCAAILAELERSPDAINAYISWLEEECGRWCRFPESRFIVPTKIAIKEARELLKRVEVAT